MKKKYFLKTLVILLFVLTASAQQGINYKAMIKDANGDALANKTVTVHFTILENGTTDVFEESHNPTTDANGIIIVNIGEGTLLSGDFNAIDWGSNAHYLNTKINSGGGLTDMGTTEFKTVPYALHSETATNVDDADADPTNEIELPTGGLPGEVLAVNTTGDGYTWIAIDGEGTGTVEEDGYEIGDFAHGGVVFWIFEGGIGYIEGEQHGLICAITDQSSNSPWYNGTFISTGATGGGYGEGRINTTKIISSQGSGDYAAYVCANYDDGNWFLPSEGTLDLMYHYREIIDSTAIANGGTAFALDEYWSSTDLRILEAYKINFDIGGTVDPIKLDESHVRAIRLF